MANVNGTEINLTPTSGMKTEAKRYKEWKKDGEAGEPMMQQEEQHRY